jgi:hypothetical protein
MQNNIRTSDPWLHAVKMLKRSNDSSFQHSEPKPVQAPTGIHSRQGVHRRNNTSVKVLEKPTRTTATVAWLDSTSCHYGDQSWSLRVARFNGVCALTGETVRKGDRVYQPRKSGHPPLNANAMILSSVLSLAKSLEAVDARVTVGRNKLQREAA